MRSQRNGRASGFGWRAAVGALAVVLAAAGAAGAAPPTAGGGVVVAYQTLSVEGINERLASDQEPLKGAVWFIGGVGFGPAARSAGVVTGGFGTGGQVKSVGQSGREVRLEIGYGGPWVAYQWAAAPSVWLQAGLGVAFGGATLTVFTGEDPDSLSSPAGNQMVFERFVLALLPEVTVGWSLTPWMHMQAGAAYLFDTGIGGEWKTARGRAVPDAPSGALSGVQYRVGIVWGAGRVRGLE